MDGQGAAAPVTAVFGIAVFLTFLLFTVQTLLHLFASSTVSAAAFDAARSVAAEGGRDCGQAEAAAVDLLGSYGAEVSFSCVRSGDDVVVAITGPSPAPLVNGFFGRAFDLGTIEREARVRAEEFRPGAGP